MSSSVFMSHLENTCGTCGVVYSTKPGLPAPVCPVSSASVVTRKEGTDVCQDRFSVSLDI